jgi:hypothetical protein
MPFYIRYSLRPVQPIRLLVMRVPTFTVARRDRFSIGLTSFVISVRRPFFQFVQALLKKRVLRPFPTVIWQSIAIVFGAIDPALIKNQLPEITVRHRSSLLLCLLRAFIRRHYLMVLNDWRTVLSIACGCGEGSICDIS